MYSNHEPPLCYCTKYIWLICHVLQDGSAEEEEDSEAVKVWRPWDDEDGEDEFDF